MSEAMETIVGNYVRLGDSNALNELRAHREKLLMDMRICKNDAFDTSFVTNVLEAEIAIIDVGLASFDQPPA
jgi:hypothetical protein